MPTKIGNNLCRNAIESRFSTTYYLQWPEYNPEFLDMLKGKDHSLKLTRGDPYVEFSSQGF